MTPIGIALGAERLQAVLPGGRTIETDDIANLAGAFANLHKAAGLPRALVTVALLPPLVDVCHVNLPPLRETERRRVLTRDAARYFIGARTPRVIGTTPGTSLVAAAEAELVASVESAITAAGWRLRAIIPAHVAWARAARSSASKQGGNVAIPIAGTVELLTTSAGRLETRRRLRSTDTMPDALTLDAYGAAAAHASHARGLELCSDARVAAQKRASGRVARVLAAAAVACLVATGIVDHWGLKRELVAIKARRAVLAPQLDSAIRLRDSLTSVTAALTAIHDIERDRPNWPALFVQLADYLPRDAHLTTFQARGDSVGFTGVAREAGAMLRELERASLVTGIRAEGTIRQEVTANGVVREHFRLAAQWRP